MNGCACAMREKGRVCVCVCVCARASVRGLCDSETYRGGLGVARQVTTCLRASVPNCSNVYTLVRSANTGGWGECGVGVG